MSQGFLIIIKHASKLGWMLCLGIGREYHIIWYGNVCVCSCVCVSASGRYGSYGIIT